MKVLAINCRCNAQRFIGVSLIMCAQEMSHRLQLLLLQFPMHHFWVFVTGLALWVDKSAAARRVTLTLCQPPREEGKS